MTTTAYMVRDEEFLVSASNATFHVSPIGAANAVVALFPLSLRPLINVQAIVDELQLLEIGQVYKIDIGSNDLFIEMFEIDY